jgi:hypothetical protein
MGRDNVDLNYRDFSAKGKPARREDRRSRFYGSSRSGRDLFNIYENVRQGSIYGQATLQPHGLKGPTVKHLFVLAKRHMISVGVGLPNQADGLIRTS